MPFQPGNKLSTGRPKGIRDKRHIYYDVQAKLREMGHDPIQAIIEMAQDLDAPRDIRLKANQELISKISPTIKAVEQRSDSIVVENMDEIRQMMDKLLEEAKSEY